jgi:hypothetical protein
VKVSESSGLRPCGLPKEGFEGLPAEVSENPTFQATYRSMLLEGKRRHLGIGIVIEIEIFDETVTQIVMKLLNRMRL